MTHTEEWHERRRKGIGGSDIGAIMGYSKYNSAMHIYLDKLGINPEKEDDNEYQRHGHGLEPYIRSCYIRDTGAKVSLEPENLKHKEHSFMLGNIDGWIGDKEAILECKNVGERSRMNWEQEGIHPIPAMHIAQVAWYLAITDKPYADVAAFFGGNNFKIYRYNRDLEYEKKIIEVGHNFWHNHVLKKIPPKDVRQDDIKRLYPEDKGVKLVTNCDQLKQIKELNSLREYEKKLKKVMTRIQNELQYDMKDAAYLTDAQDNILVSWKSSSGTKD